MVLMIDTNVILDVLLNRDGFAADSAMVWKLCETRLVRGYISTLTFANIVYVMRKELTPARVEEVYSKLRLIFDFASLDQSVIERAAAMRWEDYEDALQCAVAQRIGADYIITRNVRDFAESSMPAITPGELLEIMRWYKSDDGKSLLLAKSLVNFGECMVELMLDELKRIFP